MVYVWRIAAVFSLVLCGAGTAPLCAQTYNQMLVQHALVQSLQLAGLDMAIATPLGVLLALGLARWKGRVAERTQRALSALQTATHRASGHLPPAIDAVLTITPPCSRISGNAR